MSTLACVTGRFQPVHKQHLELFRIALRDADHLIVAITNPDAGARQQDPASAHRHQASANPLTYYLRTRLIEAALRECGLTTRTTIVPFDLTRSTHWIEYVPLYARQFVRVYSEWERRKAQLFADAGYRVEVLDGDVRRRLSASDIRARMDGGEAWEDLVPRSAVPILRAFIRGEQR